MDPHEKDVRIKVVESINKKINRLNRAINLINNAPFGVPIHIVYEDCSVGESNGPTTRQDNEMVVMIKKMFSSDILCDILAVEKPYWEARKSIDCGLSVDIIKIKNWKLFDENDAGLYVNWDLLTEGFKQLAFGK